MKILTANIWADVFGNPVEERQGAFIRLFRDEMPDVIGVQEYTESFYASPIFSSMSSTHDSVGEHPLNHVPMLYNRVKYQLIEGGFFLYDETPDPTKGITWAVLRDRTTGKMAGFCSTHLWFMWGEAGETERLKEAGELYRFMKKLSDKYGMPTFAFGDFNVNKQSSVFDFFRQVEVQNTFDLAEARDEYSSYHFDPQKGEDGLFHGKPTDRDHTHSIDHILCYNFHGRVKEYRIPTEQDLLDASDHSPVWIDAEI